MAIAAPRPCNKSGCPAYASRRGYCIEHQSHISTIYDSRRGNSAERGYDRRWRKVRSRKIKRDPLCEECNAPGQDVDHITPISKGGARYDPANLQTLCKRCHNRKTRGQGSC